MGGHQKGLDQHGKTIWCSASQSANNSWGKVSAEMNDEWLSASVALAGATWTAHGLLSAVPGDRVCMSPRVRVRVRVRVRECGWECGRAWVGLPFGRVRLTK